MPRWGDFDRFERFAPSVPREAKGGIRAQSKRGSFGETWWAKRWMQVLESFQLGGRLQRGRSYARRGQVLSVDVEKGLVAAQVQGSRPQPYKVTMQVKALSDAEWKQVAKSVSAQAIFAAKLLAGELPAEIEELFEVAGVSLFPARVSDLKTDCSCPDWSNPCKHIAAVYCLLAEEFDRDPFLILKMRGMNRDEFRDILTELGGGTAAVTLEEALPAEPLRADPAQFWNRKSIRDAQQHDGPAPKLAAALVKRLGHFPFWRGRENFVDAMVEVYERASTKGVEPG
jgi:uncharacterized Zn finger protein